MSMPEGPDATEVSANSSAHNDHAESLTSDNPPGPAEGQDSVAVAADEECRAQEPAALSHQEAMEHFQDALAEIIVGDALLQDLNTRITAEEVQSQIALEHGQAMTVYLHRADDQVLPIVVLQNASVLELKQAIRRHFHLKLSREGSSLRHISWRYIWRRHWLYFQGQKLTEDHKKLKEYGIHNQDEVFFIKKLR